jgi:hypothetical protein
MAERLERTTDARLGIFVKQEAISEAATAARSG